MAAGRDSGRRGPAAVEFRLAARLENLAVLRTLIVAVGTFSDLDLDAVADLRLAVDEACTQLIGSATPDATLVVIVDPRDDAVVVEASTTCASNEVLIEGSFSWHVISSLVDDVQILLDGRVSGIVMTSRRAGVSR